MCVLPPVPAVGAADWREEWQRRLETNEPWVLTWLRENRARRLLAGRLVRIGATTAGYERIDVPTMIVAGWADGYRNNSFRTMAALAANGVPHRLLAGPWAHADPKHAMPGPRIDLDVEMAAWFDRWLRSEPASTAESGLRRLRPLLDRARARPRPARGLVGPLPSVPPTVGRGRSLLTGRAAPRRARHRHGGVDRLRRPPPVGPVRRPALRRRPLADLGRDPPRGPIVGHPAHSAGQRRPAARLAVGEALRRLPRRHLGPGRPAAPRPRLPRRRARRARRRWSPGRSTTSTLDLDACAYAWDDGHGLRVSITGSDWPNTVAPPAPVALTIHGGSVTLPVLSGRLARADLHARRRPLLGVDEGVRGRSGRRDPRGRPPRTPTRSPSTRARTTAPPARSTSATSPSTAVPGSRPRTRSRRTTSAGPTSRSRSPRPWTSPSPPRASTSRSTRSPLSTAIGRRRLVDSRTWRERIRPPPSVAP